MTLDSIIFSNAGGRDHNEDSAGGHALKNDGGLFVLADGLGGHRFGELASKCVMDALLKSGSPAPDADAGEWLRSRIDSANKQLLDLQTEKNAKMRSTLVSLMIRDGRACWAHIGDSRLYYIHRSAIAAITADHSVAYKKYKAGEITRAQIATDEDQSSLLRVLGAKEQCKPSVSKSVALEPGDAFLLCSDGMWEYLLDDEVLVDLLKSDSAREWAALLLLRVMSRIQPGNDNLSLITVLVR